MRVSVYEDNFPSPPSESKESQRVAVSIARHSDRASTDNAFRIDTCLSAPCIGTVVYRVAVALFEKFYQRYSVTESRVEFASTVSEWQTEKF